jgi:broad specificity phosphatase PhoE
MYRTQQTANIINEMLPKSVDIVHDLRVSKYFTSKQRLNPKLREETKKYNPVLIETKEDVKFRVNAHLNDLKKSNKNIWCITHGIVIHYVANLIGKKDDPKFLNHIYIE